MKPDRFVGWVLAAPMVMVLPGAPPAAQCVFQQYTGVTLQDGFGITVADTGDANADGHSDVLVGAPYPTTGGANGYAQIRSGIDGSVLRTLTGDVPSDWFGYSVAGIGDLDLDGFADALVGAPQAFLAIPLPRGYARAFSGSDGSILFEEAGPAPGSFFGCDVAAAGDLDADGYPDLLVGAYGDPTFSLDPGWLYAYSGQDGSVLHEKIGSGANDFFGWAVASVGDVDGDGTADFAAGATQYDFPVGGSGYARAFSGQSGATLFTLRGSVAGDQFGHDLAGGVDVDADGLSEVLVGAPFSDSNGVDAGSVSIHAGAGGGAIANLAGPGADARFGDSVWGGSDLDADGNPDFVVDAGAPAGISMTRGLRITIGSVGAGAVNPL